MQIDKAIEIKARTGYELMRTDPRDIGEADRLSIEALKILPKYRKSHKDARYALLPGETKD